MIGVERTSDKELAYLEKANSGFNIAKEAFEILRNILPYFLLQHIYTGFLLRQSRL